MIHDPVKQPSFLKMANVAAVSIVAHKYNTLFYCGSRYSNARKVSNTFSIEGGGRVSLRVTGPCVDFG